MPITTYPKNPFPPSSSDTGGTENFNDLKNKPSINGVELSGNKTTDDLGLGNLQLYVETREPVAGSTFSHTFTKQPRVILLIASDSNLGTPYYLATPIVFNNDNTLAYTKAMVCNASKQFNPISGLTYDKTTKTLSFTGTSYDDSFNRTTNVIAYLA